jgi:hypothetical protein
VWDGDRQRERERERARRTPFAAICDLTLLVRHQAAAYRRSRGQDCVRKSPAGRAGAARADSKYGSTSFLARVGLFIHQGTDLEYETNHDPHSHEHPRSRSRGTSVWPSRRSRREKMDESLPEGNKRIKVARGDKGLGLYARRDIRKGEIVLTLRWGDTSVEGGIFRR